MIFAAGSATTLASSSLLAPFARPNGPANEIIQIIATRSSLVVVHVDEEQTGAGASRMIIIQNDDDGRG